MPVCAPYGLFSSLRDENPRARLFTIVRNTWYGQFSHRAGTAVVHVGDKGADELTDVSLDRKRR